MVAILEIFLISQFGGELLEVVFHHSFYINWLNEVQ